MSEILHTESSRQGQVSDERRACWIAKLLEERRFRAAQIERLDAQIGASTDSASVAVARILRAGAGAALTDIDDALARLVSGRFGRCLSCDQPIELERLDVLPMGPRCMPCQYDAETASR